MAALSPGTVIDRYIVENLVGRGAMASVYRVRHRDLGTTHALKVLAVAGEVWRERMMQEGRIQGSLRHPNVVTVTDVVDVNGAPALVMEFVPGPSLATLAGRIRPTFEQVDTLAQDLLRGLAAAHRLGFIHRDLKPANILVSGETGEVVAKVADFGLAKMLADSGSMTRTRTGISMGSPAYMSPEQFRSASAVDARADVYAAGATLYELVTGATATDQEDLIECYRAASEETWVRVRIRRPGVPERFAQAIEVAMSADPEKRPRDADAFLRLWLGDVDAAPVRRHLAWTHDEVALVGTMAAGATPVVSHVAPAYERPGVRIDAPTRFNRAWLSLAVVPVAVALTWTFARQGSASQPEPPVVEAAEVLPPAGVETPSNEVVAIHLEAPLPVRRAPAPPAPPRGNGVGDNVVVRGVDRALLQSADGATQRPGRVPPGTYTLVAFFEEGAPTPVREVTIEAHATYTFTCSEALRGCNVEVVP